MEVDMAERGYNIRPPQVDTSGPEPTFEYTDEELDWMKETVDRMKNKVESDE